MSKPSQPNKPNGLFITGTDTDIGKSFVACCLAQGLIKQGYKVSPRKPIASGCLVQTDGQLLSEDAQQLKQASQSDLPLDQICRYTFSAAISPARAIQQSGQTILLKDLVQACSVKADEFALVEGAGGFLSPLTADGLNADFALQLNYPIILVVGNRLGCLNHALLTIEAIERRGLKLQAMVINDFSQDADPQNIADLKKLTQHPVIHQTFQTQFTPLILPENIKL